MKSEQEGFSPLSLSLSQKAKTLFNEAVERKRKEAKEQYEYQMKRVGENPFINPGEPLSLALSFLEQSVLNAAANADDSIIIKYADIPVLAKRMRLVSSYPAVARQDLHVSVLAIQSAFRRAHPDFVSKNHKDTAEILIFGDNAFKITI